LQSEAVVVIGFRFGDPYIRELFDFALRANQDLLIVCCLTRSPEANSTLAVMMASFPGRVVLLADEAGAAVPFGQDNFVPILERTLRNPRQAGAAA
jgi:hypothetical protein